MEVTLSPSHSATAAFLQQRRLLLPALTLDYSRHKNITTIRYLCKNTLLITSLLQFAAEALPP